MKFYSNVAVKELPHTNHLYTLNTESFSIEVEPNDRERYQAHAETAALGALTLWRTDALRRHTRRTDPVGLPKVRGVRECGAALDHSPSQPPRPGHNRRARVPLLGRLTYRSTVPTISATDPAPCETR